MTIEPLTGGQANTVFAVTVDSGERVVLRLHPRRDGFAGTVCTIEILKRLVLPVPRIYASGLAKDFSWLVLGWTPGRELRWALADMTPAQQTRVAEQVAGFQRQVSTLPHGDGFGYVPPRSPGTHATWEALLAKHPRLSEAPADLHSYLKAVKPALFLDDITGKNVIIEDGELAGLIDLDYVCYGDPLYWLALTHVGLVCDIGEPGDFYVSELIRLWNPSALERRALAFYAVLMADDFLAWFSDDENSEWRQRMLAARDQWLRVTSRA